MTFPRFITDNQLFLSLALVHVTFPDVCCHAFTTSLVPRLHAFSRGCQYTTSLISCSGFVLQAAITFQEEEDEDEQNDEDEENEEVKAEVEKGGEGE